MEVTVMAHTSQPNAATVGENEGGDEEEEDEEEEEEEDVGDEEVVLVRSPFFRGFCFSDFLARITVTSVPAPPGREEGITRRNYRFYDDLPRSPFFRSHRVT